MQSCSRAISCMSRSSPSPVQSHSSRVSGSTSPISLSCYLTLPARSPPCRPCPRLCLCVCLRLCLLLMSPSLVSSSFTCTIDYFHELHHSLLPYFYHYICIDLVCITNLTTSAATRKLLNYFLSSNYNINYICYKKILDNLEIAIVYYFILRN